MEKVWQSSTKHISCHCNVQVIAWVYNMIISIGMEWIIMWVVWGEYILLWTHSIPNYQSHSFSTEKGNSKSFSIIVDRIGSRLRVYYILPTSQTIFYTLVEAFVFFHLICSRWEMEKMYKILGSVQKWNQVRNAEKIRRGLYEDQGESGKMEFVTFQN
jgi:hypothetical protein